MKKPQTFSEIVSKSNRDAVRAEKENLTELRRLLAFAKKGKVLDAPLGTRGAMRPATVGRVSAAINKTEERIAKLRSAGAAPAPHKFIINYQLKSGQRKRFELRSSSKGEAAALFLAMTGVKLNQLKSATIKYGVSKVPSALVEVL